MPFKINISHNGKTYKLETENEALIGKKIGETIEGNEIGDVLKNYVLKITGTSDIAGIPGIIGLDGFNYHRKLLTYGKGMRDKRNGVRLRKTLRGEKISDKTVQINTIVIKEGDKKFEELVKKLISEKEEKQVIEQTAVS
ncbi:MAG: S6e family ribosomal protein [Nanoarchaeota archaeon]